MSFAGGHYALRGGGQDPIALTLAGRTADLTIDGTAKGTFDLLGDQHDFRPRCRDRVDGTQERRPAAKADHGPGGRRRRAGRSGAGRLASEAMTLTFSDVRLELARTVK